MSPAVKGVKQTHLCRFSFTGTGLNNGTYDNLNKTASDRIGHNAENYSRVIIKDKRENTQPGKTQESKNMGKNGTFSVA